MSAAKTQADAENNALSAQQSMYAQAKSGLDPYITGGSNALNTLSSLVNPGTASATLNTLPGLQYQSQYGDITTQNALAAQGLGGSKGPLSQALSQYNQGLASTAYQGLVGNLQNLTNTGANAASALAGTAVQSGANQSSNIVGAGNALASGTLGATNAISGAAGGVGNALLLSKLLGSGPSGGGIYSLPNTLNTIAPASGL